MSAELHGHFPICADLMTLVTDLKNIPPAVCKSCIVSQRVIDVLGAFPTTRKTLSVKNLMEQITDVLNGGEQR